MKKVFFVLVLLLVVCFHSQAQLSYQVQAGVSLVDMATMNLPLSNNMFIFTDDANKARISYFLGVNAIIDLNFVSLQSGLVYSNKGMTNVILEKEAVNLHYLGLPFIIGRKIIKNFSIEAGPEINFLIHQKYNDHFEDIDVGFQLGLVYKLIEKINLKFHYYHGLTNASEVIKKEPTAEDMKLQNRMIALSVGYKL